MTTFQDPQPQSRRAVRQSERDESTESGFTQFPAQPAAPQFMTEPAAPQESWEAAARRAVQLPPAAPSGEAPPTGRRSAAPEATPEPLTYTTQSRPVVPSYDGPSFRNRAVESPETDALPPTQALPRVEQPSYRMRDFSPEGRRVAPSATPSWNPPAPAEPAVDLQYRTAAAVPPVEALPTVALPVVAPPVAAPQAFETSQPVAPQPAEAVEAPHSLELPHEHTLSRRELRALQAQEAGQAAPLTAPFEAPAAEAPAVAAPEVVAPQIVVPLAFEASRAFEAPQAFVAPEAVAAPQLHELQVPEPAPVAPTAFDFAALIAPVDEPASAPAESIQDFAAPATDENPFAALFAEPEPVFEPEPVAPVAEAPVVEALTFDALTFEAPIAAAPVYEAPIAAAPVYEAPAFEAPAAELPLVAPQPTTDTGLTNALAEFDSLTAEAPQESQPSAWSAPVGHWSRQADLDDETQPYESTINRTIGSGSTTTNALVLPSIPQGSDIRGALTSTGEIILTGSIDLPQMLSATGATSRMEHGGIDDLLDAGDHEVVSTDSAPVRALRAVSTHTSGHGVTHTQKPKGTRALTALLISACGMAVVVTGLIVAAFAFNVF